MTTRVYADELRRAIEGLRRDHWVEDGDCWFSCPLALKDDGRSESCDEDAIDRGVCTCGAIEHNERVDAALFLLGQSR